MGQFSTFNNQLNNTQRRFTYFVPRDKAWQKIAIDFPSVHKKLFMKDFAYHVSLPLHLLDKLMFIKLKLNTILFVVSDDIGTPFGGQ